MKWTPSTLMTKYERWESIEIPWPMVFVADFWSDGLRCSPPILRADVRSEGAPQKMRPCL